MTCPECAKLKAELAEALKDMEDYRARWTVLRNRLDEQKSDNQNLADQVNRMAGERDSLRKRV